MGDGTYAGGSIPNAALAPHPSRLKPVLTIIYGFASLKSPPGIGELSSAPFLCSLLCLFYLFYLLEGQLTHTS